MEIIIDGHKIEVISGETILKAAQRSGINIPNLCSAKGMCSDKGFCRLCIVELKTSMGIKLVESCTFQVWEEIQVRTSSPLIESIRRSMINLLIGRGDISPGELAEMINVTQTENNRMTEILALSDPDIDAALVQYRRRQTENVLMKDRQLQGRLEGDK